MQKETFSYESMGTKREISVLDPECQGQSLTQLQEEIISLSQDFDEKYSRFKKDSLVTKISTRAGLYEVPPDFLKMLELYWDLYMPSEKKLNPLIGFTISDLGYDENYSLEQKENIRKVPDLFETIEIWKDGKNGKIKTKEPVLFDFGALGKGYFVDKIADILKSKDITEFLVNGSGDIYYSGSEPAVFGLEDPSTSSGEDQKVTGKLEIPKETPLRAFCASGTNRRRWGKKMELNHEIDAVTLEPADYLIATWVQAETCALADALATCLFFTPPENFSPPAGRYQFEYLIMNKNREIKKSENFKAELY